MSIKKRSKKKKWITIGIITVVIAGIAVALFMRPARKSYKSAVAKMGDITTYYSFSGNVDTKNRETVMSEKVMQISEIDVKEGDTVNEGDVLMKTTSGDEIKSKISGEVANIDVEENAQVMAGTKLLEIVDYNDLQVNVKVDEYDLTALAAGKEATVKIGALNKEIKGKISSVSKEGQVVNDVTYFTAVIDLAKDSSVKIGMSADVKILNSKVTGVVTLPMTAVQFDDNNNPYVLKKDEKGAAVKAKITTGINDGTTVEVKSGVSKGETVLYTSPVTTAESTRFAGGSDSMKSNSGSSNMSNVSGGGN